MSQSLARSKNFFCGGPAAGGGSNQHLTIQINRETPQIPYYFCFNSVSINKVVMLNAG